MKNLGRGEVNSTPAKSTTLAFSQPTWSSAVLLFFICIEVFESALSAFPGITKLAIVIFRWAAVVSVIVSLTSISYAHPGLSVVSDIPYGLMRSMSVLELCLLAFLCLSMNALRLTVRDLPLVSH